MNNARVTESVALTTRNAHPRALEGAQKFLASLTDAATFDGKGRKWRRAGDSIVATAVWGRYSYDVPLTETGALAVLTGLGTLSSTSTGRGLRNNFLVR